MAHSTARAAWFEEARLGLFIHWSACASLEGRYGGEPVRQGWYGEWLRARNRVPREDWDAAIRKMRITPREVEGWAEAARMAGMKYIVFVAKHHDGLAYWPSKVSEYNFNRLTETDLDVLACLKKACNKRGIKLGFYYSQWQDWEHPFGWGNFWEFNSKDPKQYEGRENLYFWDGTMFRDNLTPEQFDQYWRQKSMPQVAELCERYKPDLLWFDCWVDREKTMMTEKQTDEMLALVRRLAPHCLVNSRLPTRSIGNDRGADFETLGDNEFAKDRIGHLWESPVTFPLSWGYNRDDQNWRPTTWFVRNLVRNISMGGNLIINIGPFADGTVHQESLVRMREIGSTIRKNREGFYGCGSTPFLERTQDWGMTTTGTLPGGQKALYLHVFDWPVDGVIRVNGLRTGVKAAHLFASGQKLPFRQEGLSVRVFGPERPPMPYDVVVRLTLAGEAQVDNSVLGEINGGELVMQAETAQLKGLRLECTKGSKLAGALAGWDQPGAEAAWRVFVPVPAKRRVRVCYAATTDLDGGRFEISAGTGKTAGGITEATHSNWSEFRTFKAGELEFPSAGEYVIRIRSLEGQPREIFKLLWLSLEPDGTRK